MDDETLLHRIANGRTDLVWTWLDRGGPADAAADNATLLQWCAYYGDTSAIRRLLQAATALASLGPDLGLIAAAFHGHWRLVEFLIESGAPVSATDPTTGESAMHAALCHDDRAGRDRVLRVLIAAGADVHARTLAHAPTGSFMRDARTRGETPLHRAAAVGTADTVRLLLAAGADKRARDAHGDTALAWASWHRRPTDLLRLLCFDEHRIAPGHRSLAEHLQGEPFDAQ